MRERKRIQGYTDMGNIQVPPLPMVTVLVDRTDGLNYRVIKNGANPDVLAATALTTRDRVWPAPSGPYIVDGSRARRLYSEGAVLLSEAVSFQARGEGVFVIVTVSPLDVQEVVWNGTALVLQSVTP